MTAISANAAPAAATDTDLYTVPAGNQASINLTAVNRGTDPAKVRIAITDQAGAGSADWIEYDVELAGQGDVLHKTGHVLAAGEKIVVRADTADVSFRADGIAEAV